MKPVDIPSDAPISSVNSYYQMPYSHTILDATHKSIFPDPQRFHQSGAVVTIVTRIWLVNFSATFQPLSAIRSQCALTRLIIKQQFLLR